MIDFKNLPVKDKIYFQDDDVVIYCGDCREILPEFGDKSFDLVLTDPPYGIDVNKMQPGTGRHTFYRGSDWDNYRPVDVVEGLKKLDIPLCLWGGNYYTDILPPNNKWLIWHKLNDGLSFSEAELAWTNYSMNTRVYSKYVANQVKLHPTEKPLPVILWCVKIAIKNSVVNLILDPFMGSGTTLVASKQLGRKSIGIELSEEYCKIAVERLRQSVMKL
jgi:DNA modification methylase